MRPDTACLLRPRHDAMARSTQPSSTVLPLWCPVYFGLYPSGEALNVRRPRRRHLYLVPKAWLLPRPNDEANCEFSAAAVDYIMCSHVGNRQIYRKPTRMLLIYNG